MSTDPDPRLLSADAAPAPPLPGRQAEDPHRGPSSVVIDEPVAGADVDEQPDEPRHAVQEGTRGVRMRETCAQTHAGSPRRVCSETFSSVR